MKTVKAAVTILIVFSEVKLRLILATSGIPFTDGCVERNMPGHKIGRL